MTSSVGHQSKKRELQHDEAVNGSSEKRKCSNRGSKTSIALSEVSSDGLAGVLEWAGSSNRAFDEVSAASSDNVVGQSKHAEEQRLKKMCDAVKTLLECIGEDPDRDGLVNTPLRYAKALLFLTKGYQANFADFLNDALFNEGHTGMVVVRDIEIHSLCEHHLLPFAGKVHIGYVPADNVIGLSKLPRIAEMFSRRLQVQERLTKNIAEGVVAVLRPQGVVVAIEACHACMMMRGVEKASSTTITTCFLDRFESETALRKEFLSLVGRSKA